MVQTLLLVSQRQALLLVSQTPTVPSCDAEARRVESCEKATEKTQLLWPSSVWRQALHSSHYRLYCHLFWLFMTEKTSYYAAGWTKYKCRRVCLKRTDLY